MSGSVDCAGACGSVASVAGVVGVVAGGVTGVTGGVVASGVVVVWAGSDVPRLWRAIQANTAIRGGWST